MTKPTVSTLELRAIEKVLDMGGGYVLDFNNSTFSGFFADLGIDIDREFPDGSKANRLRSFLGTVEPALAARVLEALLEHRGKRESDERLSDLLRYQKVVERLKTIRSVALAVVEEDVLTLDYVRELESKTEQRLGASDFEGAITSARTMLEAVLLELERRLGTPGDHKGDLQRLFKAVGKQLRIDDERADLDENFKQVVRGLVQVVNGIAPLRNKMSDGHARERKPAPHHARVVVNAAKTVATFLVESYIIQRDRGLLKSVAVAKSL